MKTVLAFGAFDPLHAGHEYFLATARTHGDRLVIALATDDAIAALKGHPARASFAARADALRSLPMVDTVVASDASGTFALLNALQPNVIALGYDQSALREALNTWMTEHHPIPIITVDAHYPDTYKSSFL